MRSYASIRHELDTGDIVLFRGATVFSRLIQCATRCPWSHVAMVMRLPEYDFLALWESTGLGTLVDLRSGEIARGVQLVPLSARVRSHGAGGASDEDLSSLFCSELVAEAYQRIGLLGDSVPSSEYTPGDFAAHSRLELLSGELGPEIVLGD